MTRWPRLAAPLACACALFAAAPAAAQTDADTRELAAYRLTVETLRKVMSVNRAMIAQMKQDPKLRETMTLAAEAEALSNKEELTEADQKRLDDLEARLEQMDEASNPLSGDSKNLSEMEARIRKYPPLMQALDKEGMAPREYATFWLTFIQAAFVHGFQKSGMLKEIPPDVNPANVKFMEEHAGELEAMQKEFQALERTP